MLTNNNIIIFPSKSTFFRGKSRFFSKNFLKIMQLTQIQRQFLNSLSKLRIILPKANLLQTYLNLDIVSNFNTVEPIFEH